MVPDRTEEFHDEGRSWPPIPLPAPRIECPGFVLRPWRRADAPALAAAWADEQIRRWMEPPLGDARSALRWIDGESERRRRGLALDLVIEVDGVVAGEVGCTQFERRANTCVIGYWVAPARRGSGLAADAVSATLAWAHAEMGLSAALATTHAENRASIRTLEHAGFGLLATPQEGHIVYAWSGP